MRECCLYRQSRLVDPGKSCRFCGLFLGRKKYGEDPGARRFWKDVSLGRIGDSAFDFLPAGEPLWSAAFVAALD
jgi:hypothetical protein